MYMIDFLAQNWQIVIAVAALAAIVVISIISFLRLPSGAQKEKILAWLLWAVTEAERSLGSGTGELKLSMVYNWFKTTFKWIAVFLPYETFKKLVDEALVKMRDILSKNVAAASYVGSAAPETGK